MPRRMQNTSSAKERLKNMLHALKHVNGSEVLVIQDDLDITCGIVLQIRVQKIVLKQWCENLSLDFTHGTNNLGVHLGNIIASGPTGRIIPVLDFLALNEKEVTMSVIFQFFKEKNT
ncbi:Serine protease family S01A [Phytophthora palmivora]|uniref:Serine protease family S01A n=1 Tax=Phytophthora palmivora TaxID=4796 RepID=A0A2P4YLE8_9STRA|nr:Serine protease family S01A [Phytophthora palmivora]